MSVGRPSLSNQLVGEVHVGIGDIDLLGPVEVEGARPAGKQTENPEGLVLPGDVKARRTRFPKSMPILHLRIELQPLEI